MKKAEGLDYRKFPLGSLEVFQARLHSERSDYAAEGIFLIELPPQYAPFPTLPFEVRQIVCVDEYSDLSPLYLAYWVDPANQEVFAIPVSDDNLWDIQRLQGID